MDGDTRVLAGASRSACTALTVAPADGEDRQSWSSLLNGRLRGETSAPFSTVLPALLTLPSTFSTPRTAGSMQRLKACRCGTDMLTTPAVWMT